MPSLLISVNLAPPGRVCLVWSRVVCRSFLACIILCRWTCVLASGWLGLSWPRPSCRLDCGLSPQPLTASDHMAVSGAKTRKRDYVHGRLPHTKPFTCCRGDDKCLVNGWNQAVRVSLSQMKTLPLLNAPFFYTRPSLRCHPHQLSPLPRCKSPKFPRCLVLKIPPLGPICWISLLKWQKSRLTSLLHHNLGNCPLDR